MSNKLNVKTSKFLTKILRHDALNLGLVIDENGFIELNKILNIDYFKKNNITIEFIKKLVENCSKKRFNLILKDSKYYIAANQGHSIKINSNLLRKITLENTHLFPNVIHGTYKKNLDSILKNGLNKMSRIHIHFTTECDNKKVISGMRSSCNVFIHMNLCKLIEDGYEFYISQNNVILSPGNKDGIIDPKYFLKVVSI